MANDHSTADIRLIQAVHNTFRVGLTRLIDATASLDPGALQSSVGRYWTFYSVIVDYHHHNEDDEDFPLLARYYPDIQPLADELAADHRQMLDVMKKIDAAVDAFQKTPDAANRDAINAAAIELRELFFPHLDREDAEILPMYAKWIPHDVWEKVGSKALKNIPKPQMAYAVGALDETIRSTPEADRPDGPPLPVKIFLSLSWRKKWAGLVQPLLVA
ncbi:MAG TPA: hemerythrin domain-containing protein [Acidimicrobiales bacterium]|jgi:hemerythrin-like domain-containing protein|nr:hemerythrin domain-containing protein [Acidimicrobiales bacterium]